MPGSDEIVEVGGKAVLEHTMSLAENDKREVCPLHGWVGRQTFQHDRHDLCEAPEGATTAPDFGELEEDPDEGDDEDQDQDDEDQDDEDQDPETADEADELDGAPEERDPDESPGEEQDVPAEEVPAEEVPAEEDASESLSEDGSPGEEGAPEEETRAAGRASARRSGIPSKKTLAVRRITRLELATGRAELKALGADAPYERPRTRGDCAQVPRPCPYVACKYSLYLDVSSSGSIILNFPHLEPGEMPAERSCALDLADQGPMTLEYIAVVTNLTRERIRQVELRALTRRGRAAATALGLGPETKDSEPPGAKIGPRPKKT